MGNQSSREMMEKYQQQAAAPRPAADASMADSGVDSMLSQMPKPSSPPPKKHENETFEQKLFRKFTSQPLIPIGCCATAYFLLSGIRSFANSDPIRSQRMMRNRVAAQFATLCAFIGYFGVDQFDFRMAPMYQDVKKIEKLMKEEEQAAAAAGNPTDNKSSN